MGKVIITRHQGLVEYLQEQGIEADRVIAHATLEDVAGQEVVGVLPYNLAARADRVSVVELDPPPQRGEDLSKEEVAARARRIETYVVLDAERQAAIEEALRERYPAVPRSTIDLAVEQYLHKPSEGVIGVARGEEMAALVRERLIHPVHASSRERRVYEDAVSQWEVKDRFVVGSLPLGLAAHAAMVSVPEFNLSAEERVRRLSAAELAERAKWQHYTVFPADEFDRRLRLLESEIAIRQSLQAEGVPISEAVFQEVRKQATDPFSSVERMELKDNQVLLLNSNSVKYQEHVDRSEYLLGDYALVRRGDTWALENSPSNYAAYAPRIYSVPDLKALVAEGQMEYATKQRLEELESLAIPAQRAGYFQYDKYAGIGYQDERGKWHYLPPSENRLLSAPLSPDPLDATATRQVVREIESDGKLMTMSTPSQAQWATAYELAHTYGHHWSTLDYADRDSILANARNNGEVRDRIWLATKDTLGSVGGVFPEFHEVKGTIEHTTLTGRLTWSVDREGGVELSVWRPGIHPVQGGFYDQPSEVLRARCDSSTSYQWQIRNTSEEMLERHVWAFHTAAEAVREIPPGMLENLREQALANEERQAHLNLEALNRSFGTHNVTRVLEALSRQEQLSEYDYGAKTIAAVQAALEDTPSMADRYLDLQRSRERSLEM